MGEDFIAEKKHRYQRATQERVAEAAVRQSLFSTAEHETTVYPCQLYDNALVPEVGSEVTLHVQNEGVDVLLRQSKIGIVLPEAAPDLVAKFRQFPALHGFAPASVVETFVAAKRIDVLPQFSHTGQN